MKSPAIQPIGYNILVEPDKEESRTSKYGLSIPGTVEQERKATGVVLAVGDLIKHIKKGDRVIFAVLAGENIELNGIKYKILNAKVEENDILAFDYRK